MRVVDVDGDEWEQVDGGDWVCLVAMCWLPSREVLDRVWGPLTEVVAQ
jgi:hypothetical protein